MRNCLTTKLKYPHKVFCIIKSSKNSHLWVSHFVFCKEINTEHTTTRYIIIKKLDLTVKFNQRRTEVDFCFNYRSVFNFFAGESVFTRDMWGIVMKYCTTYSIQLFTIPDQRGTDHLVGIVRIFRVELVGAEKMIELYDEIA